ncbi:MAG TPA: dTDP-4-dehydrorhamnose 3,5-epimerase [Vicinamibacterales bacterium]|nr:dTDP-4-dehydrorhamnose 3,5-epimerase [Vicinamibacterales bacterium]
MRFLPSELPGVIIVEPDVHRDPRGHFVETYQAQRYAEAGIPGPFVQDNQSRSARRTLRGLHLQIRHPQGKLVRVVTGTIFDVAVDVRRGSPTFGRWAGVTLSGEDFRQVYVPVGFAHGFCVTSDEAIIEYKCTDVYDRPGEIGLRWNEPAFGIAWPIAEPLLSGRDQGHPPLAALMAQLPVWNDPA